MPTRETGTAIAGISVVAFAFQSWIVNIHTIPSDTFSKQDVGAVFGIGGTSAGIASMLFTLLVGYVVDRWSYTPVFIMVGLMGPLAALLFFTIMRRIVLPNLLTVGAVDSAGEEAAFTSYGPTVRVHANGFQVESYLPGGSRVAMSGTSMSSPQVANLAAKLLAVNPTRTLPAPSSPWLVERWRPGGILAEA